MSNNFLSTKNALVFIPPSYFVDQTIESGKGFVRNAEIDIPAKYPCNIKGLEKMRFVHL